jgi:hypothetical protein
MIAAMSINEKNQALKEDPISQQGGIRGPIDSSLKFRI